MRSEQQLPAITVGIIGRTVDLSFEGVYLQGGMPLSACIVAEAGWEPVDIQDTALFRFSWDGQRLRLEGADGMEPRGLVAFKTTMLIASPAVEAGTIRATMEASSRI